jgi:polyhydroxyalkanoate synthesis regulator phasin
MVNRKVSEPVQDALKAYLELALGLTEASKKKAEKAVKKMAKELIGKGNATAAQIQGAVEDLVATSASNREAVTRLVRVEMDRTLSRVGLATSEEMATLQARVDALERQLRDEHAAARKSAAGKATQEATQEPLERAAERSPAVAKKAKATVVKKAPVVTKEPTVKAAPSAASSADVPVAPKKVAPKKVTAKKAVKKATPSNGTMS